MDNHYDGQRWQYRGYHIWYFDGYYDVHEHVDAHPIAEGLPTAAAARDFINDERTHIKLFGLVTK